MPKYSSIIYFPSGSTKKDFSQVKRPRIDIHIPPPHSFKYFPASEILPLPSVNYVALRLTFFFFAPLFFLS